MAAGFLRRKRNTWFIRIRLPRRVAACGLSGELQQTLRTSDRRLAGRMARIVALRLEAILDNPHIPPRAELEGMVRSWIDELHWRLETRRAATGGYEWFEPDEVARMGPETSQEMEAFLRLSHRLFHADEVISGVGAALGPDGDANPFADVIDNAQQFLGLQAANGTLAGRLMQRTILRGYATFMAETKVSLARIEHAMVPATAAKAKLPEFPFLQYWDEFRAQKLARRQWKLDTAANAEASRRIFEFLHPAISVRDVAETAIASAFKDKLFQLPYDYDSPDWEGLAADDLIKKAADPTIRKLATGTINKHTSCFGGNKGYWAFLVEKKYLPDDVKNPFAGQHEPVAKGRDARDKRDNWPKDLEAQYFSAPWIRGCKSVHRRNEPGPEVHRDALFWVTLWGRKTGVRESEIADAMVGQIKFLDPGQFNSISYLQIRAGKDTGSPRNVPVPQLLLNFGFLEERVIGREPTQPLFPELVPQGPGKRRSDAFSGRFTYMRKKTKCYREKMDFHAFRGMVETELKNTEGIKESWIDELIGHESQVRRSEGSRYTKEIYLPILKRCVDAVAINADLTHLIFAGARGVPAAGRDERIALYETLAIKEMNKKAKRRLKKTTD